MKEEWEMTPDEKLKYRLKRMLKRMPVSPQMEEKMVMAARNIPFDQKEDFRDRVSLLLFRLNRNLFWWEKVMEELKKPPVLKVVRNDNDKTITERREVK